MTEVIAKLTSKGQMTIPAEVRRRLGLQNGDDVLISFNDERAVLRRSPYSLEALFGSVKPLTARDEGDFDDLIDEAVKSHIDAVVASTLLDEE